MIAAFAGAFAWSGMAVWLGLINRIDPVYTYFYLFAWTAYLWVISRILHARAGRWPIRNGIDLLGWALFSTSLWCLFELFNCRLQNWSYLGLPTKLSLRWSGYALSFATVAPGILWTASAFAPPSSAAAGNPPPPLPPAGRRARGNGARVLLGLALLLLSLLWPRWFFPLIWGAVFFLADPWVERLGGHSLWSDWRVRHWQPTRALGMSGLLCGVFWEFGNYWAGGKWAYHLPYWNSLKVFEMPLLGFLGFPAFALEVHALRELTLRLWHRAGFYQRFFLILSAFLFCAFAFYEIDRHSVSRGKVSVGDLAIQ